MARHVLLNNIEHKDLKILTGYSAEFGNNVNTVLTFPTEYADIQREYPIFFKKEESGYFQSIVLLGLEKGENLFLDSNGWSASYVPGAIAREPFLIGFQEQQLQESPIREPVVHVDLDSPRISWTDEGDAVFLKHGGNSPYLEKIIQILKGIHQGLVMGRAMSAAFQEFGLFEPVNLQVEVNETDRFTLNGLYTINKDLLLQLNGEALGKLNRSGFLEGAYLAVASLTNVSKLIDIKNRRKPLNNNGLIENRS